MATNLMKAATAHQFPPVFLRYPRLLGLVHLLMRLTTLRVWYVRRAFRELMRELPQPFTLLDAGCGHGDYILPAARRYRQSTFIGVDKIEDNVAVSKAYARARGIDNVTFVQARAEAYQHSTPVDAVTCIGVMQLVEDDRALLQRFYGDLKPDGVLLLYEPIYNHRILPFYERLLERYFEPYHLVQQRRHVYTPDELFALLKAAGFDVASVRYSFGTAGKLYYEGYNLAMHTLLSAHWLAYPLLVPLMLCLMPLFWLLMGLDYVGRRRSGNGVIVVAKKAPARN